MALAWRARSVALARECRQWLGDGCAAGTSPVMHQLLQLAHRRAEGLPGVASRW
jgi:hypothetical protein